MNKKEIAEALDGIEYPVEISNDIREELEINNLVAVYYHAEDHVWLKGSISEIIYTGECNFIAFDSLGLLKSACDDNDCHYFLEKQENAIGKIEVGDYEFKTDIPHERFDVGIDGDLYCVGIVFDMKDLSTTDPYPLIKETLRNLNRGRICVCDANIKILEIIKSILEKD